MDKKIKKRHDIHVRIDEEIYQAEKKKADDLNMNFTKYVEYLILKDDLNKELKPTITKEQGEAIRKEINYIGNNLNQAVRATNRLLKDMEYTTNPELRTDSSFFKQINSLNETVEQTHNILSKIKRKV